MSTVRMLPGVRPPPEPPPRPERSFSFHFSRREGGWSGWLHTEPTEGIIGAGSTSLRFLGIPFAPTKSAIREAARAYAKANSIPYAEWVKPPDPTPAEKAQSSRGSAYRSVHYADERAGKHEAAGEWREAAHSWMHAARGCEEAIEVAPGLARHLARCAADRVSRAVDALAEWQTHLRCIAPTDGLQIATASPTSTVKE